MAKADYQLTQSAHAFYRFSYFKNSLLANAGLGFSVYDNKDITRNQVVGAGLQHRELQPQRPLRISEIPEPDRGRDPGQQFAAGRIIRWKSRWAARVWSQDQTILRRRARCKVIISSSTTAASHWVRISSATASVITTLWAGVSRPFQSIAPYLITNVGDLETTFAQTGPFPGGDTNPLNYPVEFVTWAMAWDISRRPRPSVTRRAASPTIASAPTWVTIGK